MKKAYIFVGILALVASVGLMAPIGVFAQYYGYTAPYTPAYGSQYGYTAPYGGSGVVVPPTSSIYGTCTNLTSNLYKGLYDATTGGQVSALQSFLISQGYLAVVAPTGYYGAMTHQAVSQYQSGHGLPVDGSVGVSTRASIQSVSCGGSSYNYYGAPVITSLGATSGYVGTSVTIYGSGFDLLNNTVNFGGVIISGIPSYAGTALAFTVPQVNSQYNYNYNNYNAGTYSVSVTTNRGTSNSLSFTIISGGNNYCYDNNYGYSYYNCYNNNGSLSVSNVTGPTTLSVGAQGVWTLTLYNPNSNYVSVSPRWGDENAYGYGYASVQAPKTSYTQGQQTISFTHTYQTSGYFTVVFTATDNNGAQTSVSATVNVSGSNYNQGQPYLSSISPSSARVGTQVILYGSGFTSYGNTVHFGNGGTMNISSNNGSTIYYTVPSYITPCDVITSGLYCATYAQQVTPGTYPVYVSNANGQTSVVYFTVTY